MTQLDGVQNANIENRQRHTFRHGELSEYIVRQEPEHVEFWKSQNCYRINDTVHLFDRKAHI